MGCVKLSLSTREYLSSAVNMLTNSLKISHVTKRDFFRVNSFHIDQKILSMFCRSDFNNVWARLPCYFSKGPLKRVSLDIYLTTFFGPRYFGNTSATREIFFVKMC